MKKSIKNTFKLGFGLIIGCIIAGVSVFALNYYTIVGSYVTYSNSDLVSKNVDDAVMEIYDMVRGKFVSAYKYSTASSTKCITGEETTCVKTMCYNRHFGSNKCNAGDIIKYRVNDSEIVTFHVMYDDSDTLTMQSQKNIVYYTPWITKYDYGGTAYNDKGPLTVLTALENATAGWVNVKDQTYTMGTTVFKTNASTACSEYNACNTNKYTLSSRTAKSRMITVQEAASLGCTNSSSTCPIWMYNYLSKSTSYGGTQNDVPTTTDHTNMGYWTMNAYPSNTVLSWHVNRNGSVSASYKITTVNMSARAVVKVDKIRS